MKDIIITDAGTDRQLHLVLRLIENNRFKPIPSDSDKPVERIAPLAIQQANLPPAQESSIQDERVVTQEPRSIAKSVVLGVIATVALSILALGVVKAANEANNLALFKQALERDEVRLGALHPFENCPTGQIAATVEKRLNAAHFLAHEGKAVAAVQELETQLERQLRYARHDWETSILRPLDEGVMATLSSSQYRSNSFAEIDQAWSQGEAGLQSLCSERLAQVDQMETTAYEHCPNPEFDFYTLRSRISDTCADAKSILEELIIPNQLNKTAENWIRQGEKLVEKDTALFEERFRKNAYDCASYPSKLYQADINALYNTTNQMHQEFNALLAQWTPYKEFAHEQTLQAYVSVFNRHTEQYTEVLTASWAAKDRIKDAFDRRNQRI